MEKILIGLIAAYFFIRVALLIVDSVRDRKKKKEVKVKNDSPAN